MTSIVGLDLSLTATGVALPDGTTTTLCPPGNLNSGPRLAWLHLAFWGVLQEHKPQLVVIEGYSRGSKYGREEAGEVGGIARVLCHLLDIPYAIVAPKQRAKFMTDNGNANKDQVLSAAVRSGFAGDDNNEADAWVLRQMALYHQGVPEVPITAYRTEVVNKVVWP